MTSPSNIPPVIQFGIETEIGIARDPEENMDVVAESIALVRSATKSGVLMRWDYDCEDPHADMRGFHVEELRQDTDEAHYFAQDSARELSFVEIKSDLVLGNGARFYNDHAHPEYCTPGMRHAGRTGGARPRGRTDPDALRAKTFRGARRRRSAFTRTTPISAGTVTAAMKITCCPARCRGRHLARAAQAFLVTRQIFAGRGKIRAGRGGPFRRAGISRSRNGAIFSANCKAWTRCSGGRSSTPATNRTPTPNLYRRFHVILGDANMSPFATRLKIGRDGAGARGARPQSALAPARSGRPAAGPARTFRATRNSAGPSRCRTARLHRPGRAKGLVAARRGEYCDLSDPAKAAVWADWDTGLDRLGNRPDALPQPAGLGGQAGAGPRIPGGAKHRRR